MKRRYSSKVTRKGQVTLPVQVRRELSIEMGDRVSFVMENGKLTLEAGTNWVTQTAGILKGRGPEGLTAEELDDLIDNAVAEEFAERDARSKRQ